MGGNLTQVVGDLLKEVETRWNAHDAESYAGNFAPDAEFVDVLGRFLRGRDVIRRAHQANFASIHRGSIASLEPLAIRELGSGVTLVHVRGLLRVPAGPLAGDQRSTQTWVLAERGGTWQITAFHNTLVREMPGVPDVPESLTDVGTG
jgi:uncharacterized protein (TIGR02246 family)